ncbi:unnamed protein product, partial [Rotaria sp. Silwood2]
KSSELVDSAKHTAHDANVKAHELGKSVEEKLESAEKTAEHKLEDGKHAISEKASEAKAKGAGILGATQHAIASGAAIVSEKVKHGIELASGAASHGKSHESEKQVEHKLESAEKIGKKIFL